MTKGTHGGHRGGAGRPVNPHKTLQYHAIRIAVTSDAELSQITRLSPRQRAEAILKETSPMLRRYEIQVDGQLIAEFTADPTLTNIHDLIAKHYNQWRQDNDPAAARLWRVYQVRGKEGTENQAIYSMIPAGNYSHLVADQAVDITVTTYNLTPYEREIRESLGEE